MGYSGGVSGGGGISAGAILARTVYSASAKFDVAGTLADFSAANLVVTFTAPASGKVKVVLTGASSNTANSAVWGLREGANQVGPIQYMNNTGILRLTAEITVTGLTPGNSYTYKWAGKNTGAGTTSIYVGGNGGIDGDAIMDVIALPA